MMIARRRGNLPSDDQSANDIFPEVKMIERDFCSKVGCQRSAISMKEDSCTHIRDFLCQSKEQASKWQESHRRRRATPATHVRKYIDLWNRLLAGGGTMGGSYTPPLSQVSLPSHPESTPLDLI